MYLVPRVQSAPPATTATESFYLKEGFSMAGISILILVLRSFLFQIPSVLLYDVSFTRSRTSPY